MVVLVFPQLRGNKLFNVYTTIVTLMCALVAAVEVWTCPRNAYYNAQFRHSYISVQFILIEAVQFFGAFVGMPELAKYLLTKDVSLVFPFEG
jgi:hypothetical protein